MDRSRDVAMAKRRLAWLHDTLQEVEEHANPSGSFRESMRPYILLSYMVLTNHIIDSNPSSYEEDVD